MIAPVDISGVAIETQRLILRPWQATDLQDFYEYASVDGVGQMAGWLPHESIQQSQQILNVFLEGKDTFAIVLKENGKVIGSLGIDSSKEIADMPGCGREIGYVLAKEYWGRGLMPEAVSAAIDFCFRQLQMDYLACGHFEWNHQSGRVIEKCGFRFWKDVAFKTRAGDIENTRLYILYNNTK